MAIRTIKPTPTVAKKTQIHIVEHDSWSGPSLYKISDKVLILTEKDF